MQATQERQTQGSQIARLEEELLGARQRAQEILDTELADEAAAEFERAFANNRALNEAAAGQDATPRAAPSKAVPAVAIPPKAAPTGTNGRGSAPKGGAGPLPAPDSVRGLSAPAEQGLPRAAAGLPLFDPRDAFRAGDLDHRSDQLLNALGPGMNGRHSAWPSAPWAPQFAAPAAAAPCSVAAPRGPASRPAESFFEGLGLANAGASAMQGGSFLQATAAGSFAPMVNADIMSAFTAACAATAAEVSIEALETARSSLHPASAGRLPAAVTQMEPCLGPPSCDSSALVPSVPPPARLPGLPSGFCSAVPQAHAPPRPAATHQPQVTTDAALTESVTGKVDDNCGAGLEDAVAMKLYHRFGLNSCISFEKFVQLHEAHLPREEPSARPARASTGGA